MLSSLAREGLCLYPNFTIYLIEEGETQSLGRPNVIGKSQYPRVRTSLFTR